ncbi:MAG: hypothetical protein IJT95_03070, partial [Abditibacteriota bacterium]|nr:hypothetical protein [Abditibacteriota bacterium]
MQNITLILLLLLAAASAALAGDIKPFDPEKVTWETIDEYCYTNAGLLKGKAVKGVLFNFHGAGGGARRSPESPVGVALAGDGILEIYPYGNEMYFMHEVYAAQVDHMADVIFAALELPASVPKVFSGDSMGGDGALCYSVYSKYRPAGVAAICPTTNLNDRAKNGLRDRFARI